MGWKDILLRECDKPHDHAPCREQSSCRAALEDRAALSPLLTRSDLSSGSPLCEPGTMTDERRLAQMACACNRTIRAHFNTVLRGVYPE